MKRISDQSFERELEKRLQELSSTEGVYPLLSTEVRNKYLRKANMISRHSVSKLTVSRHKEWNFPILKELKMGTLATIMIILGLMLGGTTATAYAAQDALPTDTLYPVKLLTEDIQFDLTGNTAAKLELALEFAETRISEIIQLKEEGLMPPEGVYAELENQIQQAILLSTQMGESNLEPALLQIRDRIQDQLKLMDGTGDGSILLRTRTLLQERVQLIETGLGNLNGFYFEAQNGWENTPLMNQGETQQNQIQNQNQEQNPGNNQSPTTVIDYTATSEIQNMNGTSGGNENPGSGTSTKTPYQNGSGTPTVSGGKK